MTQNKPKMTQNQNISENAKLTVNDKQNSEINRKWHTKIVWWNQYISSYYVEFGYLIKHENSKNLHHSSNTNPIPHTKSDPIKKANTTCIYGRRECVWECVR